MTKKQYAVLAAFALFGMRSREWLDEDPQRVVIELKNRQQSFHQSRRTRTDQRSSDRSSESYGNGTNTAEFSIRESLDILGLKHGASQDAIKKSYRRLVKQHHPDLGGSANEFRKINEAYQRLLLNA
jgi:DnaJ-domain-containing protein 1